MSLDTDNSSTAHGAFTPGTRSEKLGQPNQSIGDATGISVVASPESGRHENSNPMGFNRPSDLAAVSGLLEQLNSILARLPPEREHPPQYGA